jgi:actin-related protein
MKKQSDIESTAVVIDNGCGTVKAGYAGETAPELVFPAVMSKVNDKIYFGEDALRCHQDHMTRIGAPRNWDLTEKTWQHVFEKLSTPFDCLGGVLVTENPNDTKPDREKTIEILFERFQVPASYLVLAATVALYATGLSLLTLVLII